MSKYGEKELAYAEPFANALADDPIFRAWLLRKTKFAPYAENTVVLRQEMLALRDATATSWWRSHYSERCRCMGCSGQETDILAVLEGSDRKRFALHIEVKQPEDRFPANKDQGRGYSLRSTCWVSNPPPAVVPHSDATTILLCSSFKLKEYAPQPSKFDAIVTFEMLRLDFPNATATL